MLGEREPEGLWNGRTNITKEKRPQPVLPIFWSHSKLGEERDKGKDPDIAAL